MGGRVLLIGVGHASSSTVHVAEEYAGIPKASWHDPLPLIKVRMPDGTIAEHPLDTSPSCSAGFGAAEYALRRRGKIHDARVHGSLVQLMLGRDVVECVRELIAEQPDALLCTWPECKPCLGARQALREQGRL